MRGWGNVGNRLQPLEIGITGKSAHKLFLELLLHPAQLPVFVENKPEHADVLRIFRYEQANTALLRCLVKIGQPTCLVDLFPGQPARGGEELPP